MMVGTSLFSDEFTLSPNHIILPSYMFVSFILNRRSYAMGYPCPLVLSPPTPSHESAGADEREEEEARRRDRPNAPSSSSSPATEGRRSLGFSRAAASWNAAGRRRLYGGMAAARRRSSRRGCSPPTRVAAERNQMSEANGVAL